MSETALPAITRATPDDIEGVTRLCLQFQDELWQVVPPPYKSKSKADRRDELRNHVVEGLETSDYRMFIASKSAELIGFIGGTTGSEGVGAYIESVMVLPPYRGQGIGSLLVHTFENEIPLGRSIDLTVVSANGRAAVRFYRDLGYNHLDLKGRMTKRVRSE